MSDEVIFKIIEGSLTGEEFVFEEKGLCLIGRSADCALQIPKEKDMKISRRHCLLILDPPNVRIRDLGSRNGTTVNGELLDSGSITDQPDKMTPVDRILKDGDVISIGETVLALEVPSEKPPQVIPASKSFGLPQIPPATKVIKLTKPSPTKTGTLIPKSTPVSSGFFAPPPTSNVNTASRTIAMTEAISREQLAMKKKQEETGEIPAVTGNKVGGQTAIMPAKPSAGPLAPPPPQPRESAAVASGPLAPPPPELRKAPVMLAKKKEPEEAPAAEEAPRKVIANVQKASTVDRTEIIPPKQKSPLAPPTPPKQEAPAATEGEGPRKVLKAKLIRPGSTQARTIPKRLDSHMQTVVMDAKEFENIDDLVSQPEPPPTEEKPQKRVTKFRIKGPS